MKKVLGLGYAIVASLACGHTPPPASSSPTVDGRAKDRAETVRVKILGINDFHGQMSEGRRVSGRPVGGAAVLASYLKAAQVGFEGRSLIIHAGDLVGASPAESALLSDEPAIQFLNTLANADCRGAAEEAPTCNVVGTLGNHEFDDGKDELLRLVRGGNHPRGPFLQAPYPGARFPYVSANVKLAATNAPLLRPHVVLSLDGVKIGVIGAVLKQAPDIILPTAIAGLAFTDEVVAIHEQVEDLKRKGVRAIVVALHQGTPAQPVYAGATQATATVGPPIATLVSQLDNEVDVVVSGHAHGFTNAYVKNQNGHDILVVQAFSAGSAYDDIDLTIDRKTGGVLTKSARIVTTYADAGPGSVRDPAVQAIVDSARAKVAPLVNRPVARFSADIARAANSAGESQLGDLVADSQRAALASDFAFLNPGSIRTDLLYARAPDREADADGLALWGELFAILPFGNPIVKIEMTGRQVADVLEAQFALGRHLLQLSGLSYVWDATPGAAPRVVDIRQDGTPLDLGRTYTVAVNRFLAAGGDQFTGFVGAKEIAVGPSDVEALAAYLAGLPQPIKSPPLGRITRRN